MKNYLLKTFKVPRSEGLKQIPNNKTNDNYLAFFNTASMTDEFERIITILFESEIQFGVKNFLSTYGANDNPLKNQKMFHSRNVKKLKKHSIYHV